MPKQIMTFNIESRPRPDYYVNTNIKGVESYTPPPETLRFLSDLKKLEFLSKHQHRAAYQSQLGAVAIENLVKSMTEFDGDNDTLQTQYLEAADRKYRGQSFLSESTMTYWGGIGEYTAYRLFDKMQKESDYLFQFDKASTDEDLLGIDAWVSPDNRLPEFQTRSGEQVQLALAVKHVMNVPSEINDFIYPLRDEHDLDAVIDGLGTDIRSYSSPDYSREELSKCRADIKRAASKAFWRYQGYIPDATSESDWVKVRPNINELYGDAIIPTLLLVSQNRKQNGDTLVELDDLYTLEAQLTDNPDKWS